MSEFLSFPDVIFEDRGLLLAALADLGYSQVEEGEAPSRCGYSRSQISRRHFPWRPRAKNGRSRRDDPSFPRFTTALHRSSSSTVLCSPPYLASLPAAIRCGTVGGEVRARGVGCQ